MPKIETATLLATCGDPQTGSTTVIADGFGVSRVGIDFAGAGGTIAGPGSLAVFVEGASVSLPGDIVIPHAPCPLPPIHCAALVNPAGTPTVWAGTGFAGESGEDDGGVEVADLVVTSYSVSPTSLVADTPPAPTPIFSVATDVVFSYTIENTGLGDAGQFTVGLWKTPDLNDEPALLNPQGPYLLTRAGADLIGADLIDEQEVEGLEAGETYTGSFTHKADPEWSNLLQPTWFAIFPDIDATVFEINEANWVESVEITVT